MVDNSDLIPDITKYSAISETKLVIWIYELTNSRHRGSIAQYSYTLDRRLYGWLMIGISKYTNWSNQKDVELYVLLCRLISAQL